MLFGTQSVWWKLTFTILTKGSATQSAPWSTSGDTSAMPQKDGLARRRGGRIRDGDQRCIGIHRDLDYGHRLYVLGHGGHRHRMPRTFTAVHLSRQHSIAATNSTNPRCTMRDSEREIERRYRRTARRHILEQTRWRMSETFYANARVFLQILEKGVCLHSIVYLHFISNGCYMDGAAGVLSPLEYTIRPLGNGWWNEHWRSLDENG
jgi:hypothetical protein